ncbi:helix-turn-helix transcriptional regulator [Pseudoflavonifractor phocaeensis]|uniref:helix-turn-helix domain-containing protein n=1 Tax=Pseudoflavonifractor phocaeensis TaxID=1870988 RepID=UPI0025A4ACCB|nr:helix-turn-helix transcriptional regulator [Pseudoflavonifractor phocaeensis]MDM8239638.1 helix-turn-helix transcriptional regulator [Pseudoflavonifractor phocaeensis]
MYKNRAADGALNLCGPKIAQLRQAYTPALSQRALADRLQLCGLDVDKNAIQRIERGQRFVTDIELRALAEFFQISADQLLEG